ncbi:hypothetical protein FKR81_24330 [Lentzea tibetensis]|uniref:Uncharacterized protein n=1 Tax=Lentzea tibetensis TaxID=2591470 RepID=A0A563EPX5_9PSEU|nr:hypothetical protein [Lentzea tibetensis]TWP49248.1 hypothetical protein FKR81_24330 [Lentzea tibetensis]
MRKLTLALMATAVAGLVATTAPIASADEPSTGAPQLLHSFGYKNLLLGMSGEQAVATGLLNQPSASDDECAVYTLKQSEGARDPMTVVFVSKENGVEKINGTYPMKTTRGIGKGSTFDELLTAYPNATQNPQHSWKQDAPAPLNPRAHYEFDASKQHGVWQIHLSLNETVCAF